MKTLDLSGKQWNWNIHKHKNPAKTSALHVQARDLLTAFFPYLNILEEVYIPGEHQYIDLYVPLERLAVEVHGRQHFEYVQHYHYDMAGFINQKKRDARKADWCELNKIRLLILPYNEDIDEWKSRLSTIYCEGKIREE